MVDPVDEAVPFQLVASGRHSRHGMMQFLVFRSLAGWRGHWEFMHADSGWELQGAEPDFSASMLVEVAVGPTSTSAHSAEITGLVLRDGVLRVQAVLDASSEGLADIGNPFAVVATPIHDGPVALDLSIEGAIVVE